MIFRGGPVATLPSYFVQALSTIEPGVDADNAKEAHAEVSAALKGSAPLTRLGISPVLIGSYAREVSTRRVKDVDVFGRLQEANQDLRPGRAVDLFEEALIGAFGRTGSNARPGPSRSVSTRTTCRSTLYPPGLRATIGRSRRRPTRTTGPAGSRRIPPGSPS
jgi:hypothetical protein